MKPFGADEPAWILQQAEGVLATGTWLMLSDDIPEESQIVEWFYKLVVKPLRRGR